MKKIFLALLISNILFSAIYQNGLSYSNQNNIDYSIHLLNANAETVVLEFRSPTYQLTQIEVGNQVLDQVILPELSVMGESGKPNLPVISTLIGLPPTARYELHILEDVSEEIPGRYNIAPAGTQVIGDQDLESGKTIYAREPSIYQTNGYFPREATQVGAEAWLRDHRLARVTFYPFQYNPVKATLLWHKYLKIEVRFIPADNKSQTSIKKFTDASNNISGSMSPFESVLQSQVINYTATKNWHGVPSTKLPTVPANINLLSSIEPKYKISVTEDGIYKVTYEDLLAAGMDVSSVDPTTFELTNLGRKVAIYVSNIGDVHAFEAGEYILFYGQKFDGSYLASLYPDEDANWRTTFFYPDGKAVNWTPHFNSIMVEKYTDTNVYWLTTNATTGLRINEINGTPGNAETPTSYRAIVHAEQSHKWKTWHFTNEDTWFWDEFYAYSKSIPVNRTYTTTLSAIATGSYTATLRGEIVALASNDSLDPTLYPDHHTKIFINRTINPMSVRDSTWDGRIRYHFENNISQDSIISGTNALELDTFRTDYMISDHLLFDWFEIEYNRQFQAINNEIEFSITQPGDVKYVLNGFSDNGITILDVTKPLTPTMIISSTYSNGAVTFQVSQATNSSFFVAKAKTVDRSKIIKYIPPDLSHYAKNIFITHHDFLTETQRLANYRQLQGDSTLVVDIDDLYNLYNFGIYHPIAIRNFLKGVLQTWGSLPMYVLIIGDGHWNFKGYTGTIAEPFDSPPIYIPPNLEWVDPWQGEVDSANQYATLIGDDPLPDVMIGRMPVNSPSELHSIVDKIIAHESTSGQAWQKRFIFVADNPDQAGDFVDYSDNIIMDYHLDPIYNPERIYLSTYIGSCGTPYGRHSCPAATQVLTQSLNMNGAFILNYSGHASVNIWAAKGILLNEDIQTLANGDKLPILLSLDCLDGYWIHPNLSIGNKTGQGLVEELLRAENKGIAAAFSPTGLGISIGHDDLQRGFYDRMFQGTDWTMGEAALSAKLKLYTDHPAFEDLIYTYTIFGDPAMKSDGLVMKQVYLPIVMK